MEKRQKRQDSERTDNKSTEELIDTFHKTVSKGPVMFVNHVSSYGTSIV